MFPASKLLDTSMAAVLTGALELCSLWCCESRVRRGLRLRRGVRPRFTTIIEIQIKGTSPQGLLLLARCTRFRSRSRATTPLMPCQLLASLHHRDVATFLFFLCNGGCLLHQCRTSDFCQGPSPPAAPRTCSTASPARMQPEHFPSRCSSCGDDPSEGRAQQCGHQYAAQGRATARTHSCCTADPGGFAG